MSLALLEDEEEAENSPCVDETFLEKGILRNKKTFQAVFDRIYEKYGREFPEDEVGGNVIDFFSKDAETQIEAVFGDDNPDLGSRYQPIVITDSQDSDTDSDDPDMAALLHEKVVKVKKEIDWDNEELKLQERRREKEESMQYASSDESDADFLVPARHQRSRGRNRVWSGTRAARFGKSSISHSKTGDSLPIDPGDSLISDYENNDVSSRMESDSNYFGNENEESTVSDYATVSTQEDTRLPLERPGQLSGMCDTTSTYTVDSGGSDTDSTCKASCYLSAESQSAVGGKLPDSSTVIKPMGVVSEDTQFHESDVATSGGVVEMEAPSHQPSTSSQVPVNKDVPSDPQCSPSEVKSEPELNLVPDKKLEFEHEPSPGPSSSVMEVESGVGNEEYLSGYESGYIEEQGDNTPVRTRTCKYTPPPATSVGLDYPSTPSVSGVVSTAVDEKSESHDVEHRQRSTPVVVKMKSLHLSITKTPLVSPAKELSSSGHTTIPYKRISQAGHMTDSAICSSPVSKEQTAAGHLTTSGRWAPPEELSLADHVTTSTIHTVSKEQSSTGHMTGHMTNHAILTSSYEPSLSLHLTNPSLNAPPKSPTGKSGEFVTSTSSDTTTEKMPGTVHQQQFPVQKEEHQPLALQGQESGVHSCPQQHTITDKTKSEVSLSPQQQSFDGAYNNQHGRLLLPSPPAPCSCLSCYHQEHQHQSHCHGCVPVMSTPLQKQEPACNRDSVTMPAPKMQGRNHTHTSTSMSCPAHAVAGCPSHISISPCQDANTTAAAQTQGGGHTHPTKSCCPSTSPSSDTAPPQSQEATHGHSRSSTIPLPHPSMYHSATPTKDVKHGINHTHNALACPSHSHSNVPQQRKGTCTISSCSSCNCVSEQVQREKHTHSMPYFLSGSHISTKPAQQLPEETHRRAASLSPHVQNPCHVGARTNPRESHSQSCPSTPVCGGNHGNTVLADQSHAPAPCPSQGGNHTHAMMSCSTPSPSNDPDHSTALASQEHGKSSGHTWQSFASQAPNTGNYYQAPQSQLPNCPSHILKPDPQAQEGHLTCTIMQSCSSNCHTHNPDLKTPVPHVQGRSYRHDVQSCPSQASNAQGLPSHVLTYPSDTSNSVKEEDHTHPMPYFSFYSHASNPDQNAALAAQAKNENRGHTVQHCPSLSPNSGHSQDSQSHVPTCPSNHSGHDPRVKRESHTHAMTCCPSHLSSQGPPSTCTLVQGGSHTHSIHCCSSHYYSQNTGRTFDVFPPNQDPRIHSHSKSSFFSHFPNQDSSSTQTQSGSLTHSITSWPSRVTDQGSVAQGENHTHSMQHYSTHIPNQGSWDTHERTDNAWMEPHLQAPQGSFHGSSASYCPSGQSSNSHAGHMHRSPPSQVQEGNLAHNVPFCSPDFSVPNSHAKMNFSSSANEQLSNSNNLDANTSMSFSSANFQRTLPNSHTSLPISSTTSSQLMHCDRFNVQNPHTRTPTPFINNQLSCSNAIPTSHTSLSISSGTNHQPNDSNIESAYSSVRHFPSGNNQFSHSSVPNSNAYAPDLTMDNRPTCYGSCQCHECRQTFSRTDLHPKLTPHITQTPYPPHITHTSHTPHPPHTSHPPHTPHTTPSHQIKRGREGGEKEAHGWSQTASPPAKRHCH